MRLSALPDTAVPGGPRIQRVDRDDAANGFLGRAGSPGRVGGRPAARSPRPPRRSAGRGSRRDGSRPTGTSCRGVRASWVASCVNDRSNSTMSTGRRCRSRRGRFVQRRLEQHHAIPAAARGRVHREIGITRRGDRSGVFGPVRQHGVTLPGIPAGLRGVGSRARGETGRSRRFRESASVCTMETSTAGAGGLRLGRDSPSPHFQRRRCARREEYVPVVEATVPAKLPVGTRPWVIR